MFQRYMAMWAALVLLALGNRSASAYSLLGPLNEAYQTTALAFGLGNTTADVIGDQIDGTPDLGGPKNSGEGYRWNTRDLYYAFDANFLTYFGSNGVAAIDQAFAVLNNLTNFSSYSADLSEWPLTATRVNYQAQALSMLDLKSVIMEIMMAELGLAPPQRYAWVLHDRFLPAGAMCPNYEYLVIQRNFDPINGLPSTYVNGTLFSYSIYETCAVPMNPFAFSADAIEFPVDVSAPVTTALAESAIADGQYHTGLTRDDFAGLRYLMGTNTVQVESLPAGSLVQNTNVVPTLLVTSDLAALAAAAVTGTPATLAAAFPGLQILTANPYFTNIVTTNGSILTTNLVLRYTFTFGNVVTNVYSTQGAITTTTTTIAVPPQSPFGSGATTTTTTSTTISNFVNGEYFILPVNNCGVTILSTNLPTAVPVPLASVTTTTATTTNIVTTSRFYTNHTLVILVPTCVSGNVALREGMDQMHFSRKDFDSLIGQTWSAVSSTYQLTAISNSAPYIQTIYRTVTAPDILFTATDLDSGPAAAPVAFSFSRPTPNFVTAQALPGLAGPGIIQPAITITFNKVTPTYINVGPFFADPNTGTQVTTATNSVIAFNWGSFDGTTNPPVLYPSSASLANLQNQIFLQITVSGPLAIGNVGLPYSAALSATGLQGPPYTWSLAPGSAALPPGLNLSAAGIISGTPSAGTAGTYDIIIQVVDTAGRTSQRNFSIEIDP